MSEQENVEGILHENLMKLFEDDVPLALVRCFTRLRDEFPCTSDTARALAMLFAKKHGIDVDSDQGELHARLCSVFFWATEVALIESGQSGIYMKQCLKEG